MTTDSRYTDGGMGVSFSRYTDKVKGRKGSDGSCMTLELFIVNNLLMKCWENLSVYHVIISDIRI